MLDQEKRRSRKKRTEITNIRNEKGVPTTESTNNKIQATLYQKFDNSGEMEKCIKKYNLTKLTQK